MITLTDIKNLLPHEEIIPSRLEEVKQQIKESGNIDFPIIVDKITKTIIDGHHRYMACLEFGFEKIPVFFVEYFSENVKLESFRNGETVSKEDVICISKQRKRFPAKTTKHSYNFEIYPVNYKIGN